MSSSIFLLFLFSDFLFVFCFPWDGPHVEILLLAHLKVEAVVAILQIADLRDGLAELVLVIHLGVLLAVGHQHPQLNNDQ